MIKLLFLRLCCLLGFHEWTHPNGLCKNCDKQLTL